MKFLFGRTMSSFDVIGISILLVISTHNILPLGAGLMLALIGGTFSCYMTKLQETK